MRVYAAPLVSQDAGVHAIIHQGEESFDCLRYYRRLYPNHNHTFDLITNLRQQAFTMYLNRALPGCLLPNVTLTELTESFKKALELFPEGSPGKHVLVWAAFIAALESRTPEHRLFFEEFLETQYYRNGFANISRALELLRKVWAEDGVNSWPSLLPDFQVFIM